MLTGYSDNNYSKNISVNIVGGIKHGLQLFQMDFSIMA
jgi:hypothetical protein